MQLQLRDAQVLEWRPDWEVKVLNSRHLVVLATIVEEAEGPPEAVVAMTARVATTQTQALKPMHQQHLGATVLAEVAVVGSEAVVVVATEVAVVGDGSTNDMMPAAEGTRQRRSMVLDVETGEQRRRM